jgi:hypothetical protein
MKETPITKFTPETNPEKGRGLTSEAAQSGVI